MEKEEIFPKGVNNEKNSEFYVNNPIGRCFSCRVGRR